MEHESIGPEEAIANMYGDARRALLAHGMPEDVVDCLEWSAAILYHIRLRNGEWKHVPGQAADVLNWRAKELGVHKGGKRVRDLIDEGSEEEKTD
jgi:hypothetical protein